MSPHNRTTWAFFVGLEDPSLKFLRSVELQRTNYNPISHYWCSKLAIFFLGLVNINYNRNLLLWLRIGKHIIYISIYVSDERCIPEDGQPLKTSGSRSMVSGGRSTVSGGQPRPHPTSVGRTLHTYIAMLDHTFNKINPSSDQGSLLHCL